MGTSPWLASLRATALLATLCCLVYPAVVTGIGAAVFPERAAGSLVRDEAGEVRGSRLLGQAFTAPGYLHGRPSAGGYDPSASGGSNLGMTSRALAERRDATRAAMVGDGEVPEVLLAASGSGLDPHLPPQAARWQAARIARARGVDEARVQAVIDAAIEGRDLGVLGEPRVNVLEVNLALDRRFPPGGGR